MNNVKFISINGKKERERERERERDAPVSVIRAAHHTGGPERCETTRHAACVVGSRAASQTRRRACHTASTNANDTLHELARVVALLHASVTALNVATPRCVGSPRRTRETLAVGRSTALHALWVASLTHATGVEPC